MSLENARETFEGGETTLSMSDTVARVRGQKGVSDVNADLVSIPSEVHSEGLQL